MSNPALLQDKFTGIWRDAPRDALPAGRVWDLLNLVPEILGSPLRRRGGWSYHGSALTSLDASAGVPSVVAVAPFSGGTQVVALDDRANPELFDLTNSADRGSLYGGAASRPLSPAVFYREQLIFPSHALSATPATPRKYVAAGGISDLTGAPGARCLAVYKDRLVAGSADTDTPNRIYFSAAGNAESWDTTNRYIDTSAPPIALAALRNMLLVFHSGSVERIRGDIPPGSAAANMTLEPLFHDIGLIDSDALAVADDHAYWADENGVYRSDGSAPQDLTKIGGISSYWREQIAQATVGVSLAVWRGFVWVSLVGASDAIVAFFVYNIDERAWFRFVNIKGYNFATQFGATDELYFSNRDTSSKRIGKLSSVLDDAVDLDANGDAVICELQTPFYDLGNKALKRWRFLYLRYSLADSLSDPVFDLDIRNENGNSVAGIVDNFAETPNSGYSERRRARLGVVRDGLAFSLITTAGSPDIRIVSLEADVSVREGSRR